MTQFKFVCPDFTPEQSTELLHWADFLNNTKLQRGYSRLRSSTNTFCCLGIACHMHNKYLWKLIPNSTKGRTTYRYQGSSVSLSASIKDKLGLSTGLEGLFVTLNDDFKYSFKEISAEIRHLVVYKTFSPLTMRLLANISNE